MSRRNLILLFGFVALVAVVAIVATADMNEERGTRAGETYVGTEECNSCHHAANEYVNWSQTFHGIDFENWDYHGTPTNKFTYCGDSMLPCHTIGYNQIEYGGFNPAFEWNSTDTSTNIGNINLTGIGCEACHGPGSAHKTSMKASDINIFPYYSAAVGTLSTGSSCAGPDIADCHYGRRQWGNETLSGWNTSAHAPWDNDPEDSGFTTSCAECKSPSQWDPTATRQTADPIAPEDYRGITCGDCHDLHPDPANTLEYQLNWEVEDTCDICHNGGHHETMRTKELSGEPSVNRTFYPYMDEVSCVECHMWSSPSALRGTEYEHVGHSMEPTIDACLECHTSIFEDIPDTGDTVNWTAWEADYAEVYEEWEEVVHAAQERHEDLIFIIEGDETTKGLLDEVEELMEVAEGNGTWTDHLEELFEQAEYDYELAEHKAKGAHNPAYGIALLNAAKTNFTEIIDELSEGTLKGKVTDSPGPLSDVYITAGDMGTKTASDGTFTLILEPGTYTVKAFKMGSIDKSVSNVIVSAAAITWQNFTLADDFDNDGTPDSTDTDDDNDGMPDVWEINNSLNPRDPSDTYADPDNDGMTNLQEYKEGKDPQVADKEEVEEEEADTTLYLSLIVLLIIIIAVLGVMLAKKGGGAPALPPETKEPREELPLEKSEELEEEKEVEE